MNILIQAILAVIVAIIAIYLIGVLAAAIALPAVIWTLLKIVVGIAAIVYIVRLFGIAV